MPLDKQQLIQENNTNFPNNNSQFITPALLRQFNADMIDSMQLTQSMSEYAKLNAANQFTGNQTITGNLNVTGVISASVLYVQTETASVIYSSGSNQLGDELTDVQTLSGSVKIQGTLLLNGQPISTSSVSVDTGSLVTTASFNQYTQSTNLRLNSLETNSASVNVSISNLNQTTASLNTSVTNLNQFTASQNLLNGTFATTGSNTFTGNQIIDRASKLYTNGIYWTDVTAGFNNLEIINQGGGNLDFASLNGGRMRVVNTPLQLTGSVLSSNSDISTSANIYAANLTGSGVTPAGTISSSAQITALGFVSSSVTASSLITASAAGATITFTKGDNTQFSISVATGSFVSASYAETASLAINAKDIIVDVKNTTGAQINKGTVVRIIGATGDNPLIGTASWTNDANSANTLGFVISDIANDAFGTVMTQGTLLGVNTDPILGYTAGQLVYLSSSGQFTNVKPPAPFHEVRLGQVLRAQQNNGSIYVLVQNGYELEELHDVDINTGSLANNNLLAWNSATLQWENKTITEVGATTTASFNAYTSSTNSRLSNIETTTASLLIETQNLELFSASALTSLSNLNTATSSLFTSASLSLTTASFSGNTLTFRKGDGTTFGIVIPDVSGSTINTASFATTGSNSFNGNQIITGSMTSSLDIRVAGVKMGFGNPLGTSSIAIGTSTLLNNTGNANIAIGTQAMQQNTTGGSNLAMGLDALQQNTTGQQNVALGEGAFRDNRTGIQNTIVGHNAGLNAGNVSGNTLIGQGAGRGIRNSNNTIIGQTAAINITSGSGNTIIGQAAGVDVGVGSNNIFIGQNAGRLVSGSNNTLIGASQGVGSWSNVIALSDGAGNIRAQFIGNEWDLTGSVDIQNTLTASLAQGFTYVGNASGRTIAVSTSSFASTINTGSFATTGSNAFFGTNTFSGAVSFSGSAPSILSSSFSGSLITNLTDIYTDIPAVQQIVTLTSASYAGLVSGSLTNPNTLYIVSGSISGSGGGTTDITSLNAFTASQELLNTTFATTGSNSFNGDQNITGSLRVSSQILFGTASLGASMQALEATGLQVNAGESGSFSMRTLYGGGVGVANIEAYDTFPTFNTGGKVSAKSAGGVDIVGYSGAINVTGSSLVMQGFTYPTTDGTNGQVLTTNGSKVLSFTTVSGGGIDTGSFATTGSNTFTGDQTFIDNGGNFFTITDASGSMMLVGKSMPSSSLHISASAAAVAAGAVNLIFKPNNLTSDTIVSGSNNIFQNPAAPTAGFKRYLSSNNIALGGGFPQISGSMQFSPSISNNYLGAGITVRGPVSASSMTVSTNALLGAINVGSIGSAVLNAEKLTGTTNVANNFVAGNFQLIANQSEIRQLTNITQNNINGFVTLNLSSSATIFGQNTINDGAFTFTNQFSSGSLGFGQASVLANTIGGTTNTFIATGSQPVASAQQAAFQNNLILGASNIGFVNSSGARVSGTNVYHQLLATSLLGNRLIVTGSNASNDTTSFGSAFVGRFNASDGIRDKSSDVIFAVGTGTSTSNRKTGFLIDSGSNSFFEGAVNISGSLLINGVAPQTINTGSFATTGSNSFDGNQRITGSLTISGSIITVDRSGYDQNVYVGINALGMGGAGAQPLAEGNTISIAIGNGAMRFASGSNQNVAIGNNALLITTGSKNFAMGSEALSSNTTGQANIAIGTSALTRNVTGESNTAIGDSAGFGASGSYNTLIGASSGYNVTGSFNTILGTYQGVAGQIINNNIVLSDGQGNAKAQYSGSAWSFQDNIKFNKGSNKTTDIVTVNTSLTVSNSLVTTNSIILVTTQDRESSPTTSAAFATVGNKGTGTFDIFTNLSGDLKVAYLIINPTS